jgi:predicted pyridoxine 5'-phosphate oxidase superfamily flavin-nucleotide-binding protein
MATLNEDMKRVIRQQRLGFIATVCPDNTPNLSPKGTTAVWDDEHLVFGNLASPSTMENLRHNPALEINIVDTYARKGYRFKGTASIVTEGELFQQIRDAFVNGGRGVQQVGLPANAYVLMKVETAAPLVSPAYTPGKTEEGTRLEWAEHWLSVQQDRLQQLRETANT